MILEEQTLSVSITSIPAGTTSETFTLETRLVPWDIPEAVVCSSEGILSLDVTRTEYNIIVRGTIEADFRLQCARCLAPVVVPVSSEVERIYSWDPEMLSDPEVEQVSHNDGSLSILDPVREAIIFSLPRVPLCSEGCRGLCPVCGANRNEEECGHDLEAWASSD